MTNQMTKAQLVAALAERTGGDKKQAGAALEALLEPGMAMLTKPFAVDALTRKIGQLLEHPASGLGDNSRTE